LKKKKPSPARKTYPKKTLAGTLAFAPSFHQGASALGRWGGDGGEAQNPSSNGNVQKRERNRLAMAPPTSYQFEEETAADQNTMFRSTPGAFDERPGGYSVLAGRRTASSYIREQDELQCDTLDENNADTETSDQAYLTEAHTVVDPVLVSAKPDPWLRRNRWWIVGIVVVVSIIAVGLGLGLSLRQVDPSTNSSTAPTDAPTTVEEGLEADIRHIILSSLPGASFSDEAFQWVLNNRHDKGSGWYTDERILQQYSLLMFYLTTSNGTIDTIDSRRWLDSDDECYWHGVDCNGGIAVGLNLTSNNLNGIIPSDIGILLNGLLSLDLSDNSMAGSLPPEIFALTKLTMLDLSKNELVGDIPTTINKVQSLMKLDFSENQLSSTIPTEIGMLGSIKTINLAHNNMIGSIPSEIGLLGSTLIEFDGRNNAFSYKLPTEMGHLNALGELHLQNNDLLGPIPSEMGLMQSLRIWNMSHNHVFDKIPSSLWRSKSLQSLELLDLSHNLLTGSGDFGHVPAYADFYSFGYSWKKLTSLRLGNNFFRGKIDWFPTLSSNLRHLEELDLSSNYFTGTISKDFFLDLTDLKFLDMSRSGVSGSLPTEIGMLGQLQFLDMSSNLVTGAIPSEIGQIEQLLHLRLESTKLVGTIPTDIGKLKQLQILRLDHEDTSQYPNYLSGSIPTEIGMMTNLQQLRLNRNFLAGPIPKEIGELRQLDFLDLGVNFLSGFIPTEIRNANGLEHLDIQNNRLTGSIPFSFCEMDPNPYIRVDCDPFGVHGIICHCCEEYSCTRYTMPSVSPLPTMAPSTSQAPTLSIIPTSHPTASLDPTKLPSLAPTVSPLPTIIPFPTMIPSTSPSQNPTEQGCSIHVHLNAVCNIEGEPQDCRNLPYNHRYHCNERPHDMVFSYTGGTCDQSNNVQSSDIFQCFDFQGGPPTEAGTTAFITVTDILGVIVYHAGTVEVSAEYNVKNPPFPPFVVESRMNITVWTSSNTIPENMLQTLVFESSCNQNLFQFDRFGAHLLVFETQDLVGYVVELTLTMNITNSPQGLDASLQALTTETSFDLFDFTDSSLLDFNDYINGVILKPGTTLTPAPTFDIFIDPATVTFFLTNLEARDPRGNRCQDADYLSISSIPFPPCSVCGRGLVVTRPEAIFDFLDYPGQPRVSCKELELGEFGLLPSYLCLKLPSLIADVCGCRQL